MSEMLKNYILKVSLQDLLRWYHGTFPWSWPALKQDPGANADLHCHWLNVVIARKS